MIVRPIAAFLTLCALVAPPLAGAAAAQGGGAPQPSSPAPSSRAVSINGYALVGRGNIDATQTFGAIFGKPHGLIAGGGARVGLPLGLFVDVGAWRYHAEGERVFVSNTTVIPLNIPVEVTMTPFELSAGWRFRVPRVRRLSAYLAGGLTVMNYHERSDFNTPAEDVDETFAGFHVIGGAEVRLLPWIAAAGEVTGSTVPHAIGQGGASAAFNEHNLGGSTVRVKIIVGR